MDKEVVVIYVQWNIAPPFESVVVRWMNIELNIQSEVSQKDKNKHYIIIYMESRKCY